MINRPVPATESRPIASLAKMMRDLRIGYETIVPAKAESRIGYIVPTENAKIGVV
jgi:hypothetical protein